MATAKKTEAKKPATKSTAKTATRTTSKTTGVSKTATKTTSSASRTTSKTVQAENSSSLLNHLTARIVMISSFCTLGTIILILVAIYAGLRLGFWDTNRQLAQAEQNETLQAQTAIIPVSFNLERFTFNSRNGCLSGNDESECFMKSFDSTAKDFTVIRTTDQLNRFTQMLGNFNSADVQIKSNIAENFFFTGMAIAVVDEAANVDNIAINGIYRDENYDLHVELHREYSDKNVNAGLTGKVALISLPNIQSERIVVDFDDENTKSLE